jgi:hypothetical protein
VLWYNTNISECHAAWRQKQHGPLKHWYANTLLTQCHNPKDHDLNLQCHENLKSCNWWIYLIQAQPSLAMLSVGCTTHSTMTSSSCFNISVAWGMLADSTPGNKWFSFRRPYVQSPVTFFCEQIKTFPSGKSWILEWNINFANCSVLT